MTVEKPVEARIIETLAQSDVVVFMKGTKMMPQCGFSQRVSQILQLANVDFTDVNVLADDELREAIKLYSNWPTIPQLYVKGEFQGGCDIISEMAVAGELKDVFEENGIGYDADGLHKVQMALQEGV